MYCKNCGKQIPLGQTECKLCNGQAQAPANNAQPQVQQNQRPPQPGPGIPQNGPAYSQPSPGYGQPAPGYQQPGQYAQGAPVAQKTNTLAIAALVTGILGMGLIPLIMGIIAQNQIKADRSQTGSGLAIAGIILGVLSFLGGFVVMAVLFPLLAKAREQVRQQQQFQQQFQQQMPSMRGMNMDSSMPSRCHIAQTWKEAMG